MPRAGRHREALVRTAMRLFRRQGYAATGLQQILAEAGVPKGSLYHHFPGGKESLAEAAVLLAGELVADLLQTLAERHGGNARAFVTAYCRKMGAWMRESNFQSGCPIATTLLETTPASPALTRAGNQVLDTWVGIIGDVFRGDGLGAAEARIRAEALVAAVEGGLLLARVRRSARPLLDLPRVIAP